MVSVMDKNITLHQSSCKLRNNTKTMKVLSLNYEGTFRRYGNIIQYPA